MRINLTVMAVIQTIGCKQRACLTKLKSRSDHRGLIMGIWNILTGGVTQLVGQYFTNKQEQQKQTHTQKMQIITGKQDWETLSIKQMAGSLKDEYLLFIFSLPLITIFCSPLVDLLMLEGSYQKGQLMTAALLGLQGLESTPLWYTYTLGIMISASFGIKGADKMINKLRGSNGNTK